MTDAAYKALAANVARVLRHDWDPIGLGADGPADEYDSYVPGLVAIVQGTAVETAIAVVCSSP